MSVRPVDDTSLALVRAFLERYLDTAFALLCNLERHGPRRGDDLSSGNFKYIEQEGRTLLTDNPAAQRLYESFGFRSIGRFALLSCSSDAAAPA